MADTATQQVPTTPQGIKKKTPARNPIKKVPEAPLQTPDMPSKLEEEAPSQIAETVETNGVETDDGQTETAEGVEYEEDDEEGGEVIQAGSVDHDGNVINSAGDVIGHVNGSGGSQFEGSIVDQEGDILDAEGNVIGQAELKEVTDAASNVASAVENVQDNTKPDMAGPFGVQDNGEVTNATGVPIGKLVEGTPQDLVGTSIKEIDTEGNLKKATGSIVGKADMKPDLVDEGIDLSRHPEDEQGTLDDKVDEATLQAEPVEEATLQAEPVEGVDLSKHPEDEQGTIDDKVDEATLQAEPVEGVDLSKHPEDEQGTIDDKVDETVPQEKPTEEVDLSKNPDDETGIVDEKIDETLPEEKPVDIEAVKDEALMILEGKKINKLGKAVDEKGTPWGILVEGDAKRLIGKTVDSEGKIWDDKGKVVGRVELLPESERPDILTSPFEDFPDAIVDKTGKVIYEGQVVGKLIDGDAKALAGKKVDADGDVLDKHGNVLGKAERAEEEEVVPEPEPEPEVEDLSILEGKKVNKAGNIVDDNGKLFGKLVTGDATKLYGKKCDAEGKIWSESGKVIGTAELIPMDDRDVSADSPFEDFPDATVNKNGHVLFDGVIVGRLIEGDAKKLLGKKVDKDGEIVDKIGNVIGKAERWEEEEAPPEPEPEPIDMSALAGKRVNKLGNVVDTSGQIYGRVIEGDIKRLVGKMCDKKGQIWSEGGDIIGKAELVPESEREGQKEGSFAGFDNPTVTKDGKVADSHGAIIGRVLEGDVKKLYGKPVDPDGDILDNNGNSIGKAERWEEEEKLQSMHPAAGRKVNKKGEVVDENGDLIAKLTDGDLQKCAGKEIDGDGDVIDGKGTTVGHVTLIEDIPEPEPEPEPEAVVEEPKESEEEIEKKRQLEQDKKLANQMAGCIQQSIDKIQPILRMITDAIEAADRQPKEELDEQKLVDTVKPLIEQGGEILQECNGVIRGLDPDGRISSGAKAHAASREATPEEYRLADLLKELAAGVTQTIDSAKKKIAGMPHAKKELNPLWNLLAEPLGQIIAAVGLLLSGVLGLVGRLLSGLGLGGLLDNLLGGLGLKQILKGLGLGMITESLTGRK